MTAVAEMSAAKTIRYSFKENPTIQRFSESQKFISMIMGPFGSGKSSGCLMTIVKKAKLQKPQHDGIRRVRWAIVRNTFPQLRDTTLKTVKQWFPDEHFGTLHGGERGPWDYYITALPGYHFEFMFRALDRDDHIRNLLSLELTGAWLNEYREIPKSIFEAIQGRVGRYPAVIDGGCDWYGIIGDTNPPEEGSYYHNLFENERPDNAELFKQPGGLEPGAENLRNLPNGKGYYLNLAKGKDRDFVIVYIDGKYGFILTGERVVPEYNEEIHRAKSSLPAIPNAMGVRFYDGGLHPTCIIGQITPVGRLFIHRTFRGDNIGMKQLITGHVKPFLSYKFPEVEKWRDIGDPSLANREQSNSDSSAAKVIEQEFGTKFEPGPVKWEPRREGLKNGMNHMISGKPWVQIDADDEILHQALRGGWHYNVDANGTVMQNEPVKDKHSHPGDAFAYGLATLLQTAGKKPEPLPVQNMTFGGKF